MKSRSERIKQILTKDFLEREYLEKKKSSLKISKETGLSKWAVLKYLSLYNIPKRKTGFPKGGKRSLESRLKQSEIYKNNPDLWKKTIGKCHKSGTENNNYKHGRYIANYCIDCGKKISPKATRCVQCSNRNKRGKNNPSYGKTYKHSGWWGKGGYYKGIWLRSSYEILFAILLDLKGIEWDYEPKAFDLGNATYIPDFYLPEEDKYIEIKGYFDKRTKDKLLLFEKMYPDIKLEIVMKPHLQALYESFILVNNETFSKALSGRQNY